MTRQIKTIAMHSSEHMRKVVAALTAVTVLSLFLYGVFLLEAVAHTASRADSEAQIRTINVQLGTLEATYLSKTQDMNPQRAANLGFVAPTDVTVVFATPANLSRTSGNQGGELSLLTH